MRMKGMNEYEQKVELKHKRDEERMKMIQKRNSLENNYDRGSHECYLILSGLGAEAM